MIKRILAHIAYDIVFVVAVIGLAAVVHPPAKPTELIALPQKQSDATLIARPIQMPNGFRLVSLGNGRYIGLY